MEYVCIGGAMDGSRVTVTSHRPFIVLSEFQSFFNTSKYDYQPTEKVYTKTTCYEYRLEYLTTVKSEVAFYISSDISLEEALALLVGNYAISDPTKPIKQFKY